MSRIREWAWWSEARSIAARLSRRGASDAAEDLAQDLAVRALEEQPTAERPGAWLERVARNRAIDGWRVEHRRRELVLACPPPAPGEDDPEAHLLARERHRTVRRALLALPRDQRRAAVLRYHGDLPFDAVAARLGTEPATARTRVHRALARLRDRVQGLRVVFVGWKGAQATALGLALVGATGIAPPVSSRPPLAAPAIALQPRAPGPRRSGVTTHAPVVAEAPPARRHASPPPATARPTPAADPTLDLDDQPPPLRQEIRFGDDIVEGTVTGPEGERIFSVKRAPQPSLIEIRREFVPEMVKSLEDL